MLEFIGTKQRSAPKGYMRTRSGLEKKHAIPKAQHISRHHVAEKKQKRSLHSLFSKWSNDVVTYGVDAPGRIPM